jgi:uncharacterized protein (UPF0305 family)
MILPEHELERLMAQLRKAQSELLHPCGERVSASNPIEKHRDCYYCNVARNNGHGYTERKS